MDKKGFILKSISMEEVAEAARHRNGNILIVDCRPFLSYNTCHIKSAINIYYNHIMSRRKNSSNKISVYDFVQCPRKRDKLLNNHYNSIVFYDQSNDGIDSIPAEDALYSVFDLFVKEHIGREFYVMKGGFDNFSSQYPAICKKQPPTLPCIQNCHTSPARNSMVKLLPATSVANTEREQDIREGRRPVEILPFLYLGCAEHSSCKSILEELNITAILNVTKNCPNYFEDSLDYKNIPIDDSLSADIQKWFDDAVSFIAKVRSLHGKVLVHCYGGVSRSATICIAYLVHAYSYSVNQAYDYVKKKRPIISPNLNFMGQLMAYQKRRNASDCSNSDDSSSPEYGNDRHSAVEMDCSSSTPVSSNGAFDFNSAAIICK